MVRKLRGSLWPTVDVQLDDWRGGGGEELDTPRLSSPDLPILDKMGKTNGGRRELVWKGRKLLPR